MSSVLIRLAPLALAAYVLTAAPAYARGEPARVAVGVTAGSLGIGPEASLALGNQFAVRGNVTLFTLSHGYDSDDIHYDGRATFGSAGLMVDYHIGGSGFFVSAGARLNRNRARVTATPTGVTEVGDTAYTPDQIGTLTARADFKPVAPTLSLGYSGHLTKGFKLGIEAGAMFQDSVRVKPFEYTGSYISAADLENERQSLQSDAGRYKIYPILQLTGAYHF